MLPSSILIQNFKSINNIRINLDPINGSRTFMFIGINESGKSNILESINLFNLSSTNYINVLNNDKYYSNPSADTPIICFLEYDISKEEFKKVIGLNEKTIDVLKLEYFNYFASVKKDNTTTR